MGMQIPPIHQSIEVPLRPRQAFALFTERIAEWWPYNTHFSRGPVQTLVLEGRQGGVLREVCTDGAVVNYGEVLVWEPPRRVVIKWMVDPGPATEVEVRFTATKGGCRLDLEHRGFDARGKESGRIQRDSYSGGWPGVLELFEAYASKIAAA